ncbi:transposase [Microseira wollei NIES-4236]|uniref:Transposase n=1 Tax=Microseira wollei NIES-4236 TaxID=2530354 RepID=A0AAV3XFQ1_9CYAN|nr:hypothetical protein [Microseira wollei]GET38277.1 transposase [Microseira wollei NIES-4236]
MPCQWLKPKALWGCSKFCYTLTPKPKRCSCTFVNIQAELLQQRSLFRYKIFFKTGKLLTGKFDLVYQPSVSSSTIAQSLPSTPMQQTLMSVAEAFKSFKELRDLHIKGKLLFKPRPPHYLTGSKLFKVAYPNSGGQQPTLIDGKLRFSLGLTISLVVWDI